MLLIKKYITFSNQNSEFVNNLMYKKHKNYQTAK